MHLLQLPKHKSSPKSKKNNYPAYDKTCNKCRKPDHFRAVCQSQPRINFISKENPDNLEIHLSMLGGLPNHMYFPTTNKATTAKSANTDSMTPNYCLTKPKLPIQSV